MFINTAAGRLLLHTSHFIYLFARDLVGSEM